MSVLVLAQHITVQQVMLFVQIQLPHVPVQAVAQCLIVSHVLILMVYADIQRVVVILVATRTVMVLPAPPVTLVAMALVLRMSQQDKLVSTAPLLTIAAAVVALAQRLEVQAQHALTVGPRQLLALHFVVLRATTGVRPYTRQPVPHRPTATPPRARRMTAMIILVVVITTFIISSMFIS